MQIEEKVSQADLPSNVARHGKVPKLFRHCRCLLYWDWLLRFWTYFDTVPNGVAWLSCAGFYFGEGCYVIGSFAADDRSRIIDVPGNCMQDRYDWLVTFMYFLGDVCWLPAVVCLTLEAINRDYQDRVDKWTSSNSHEAPPRYRWFGLYWWSLEWWGAVSYASGVFGYLTASTTDIIHDCVYIDSTVLVWLTAYTNMGAGILFFLAGVFYAMDAVSIWLLPAILLPYRRKDWTSVTWWVTWLHFWGGACFLMTGIMQYWRNNIRQSISEDAYLVQQSIGWGFGSLLFHVGGWIALARQSHLRYFPKAAKP
ncbi:hypothetical protein WJX73_002301 [Symbiochloris irregularis]|uniref:Uncharacterized protein n=1 Tax=Symbiochloris irregularis TaxID=706552 RepID=A0AAW1NV04_9CHLO